MVRVRPTVEALLGNVEELLLMCGWEVPNKMDGARRSGAPCPDIVRMVISKHEECTNALVGGGGVHTREQASKAFEGIQWIADKRKTKAEERTLKEKVTRVFRCIKEMILTYGDAEEWKKRACNFGAGMKDLIWFLEVVDTCMDI